MKPFQPLSLVQSVSPQPFFSNIFVCWDCARRVCVCRATVSQSILAPRAKSVNTFITCIEHRLCLKMSFNCLRKIFGPNAGLSISAETRPVIYPGDDDKGRMGVEKNAKLIRFATVLGYVLSVSIAATLLSLYYVFIWDPSSHQNSATLNASQHPVDRHPITTSNPGDESSNATLLRPLLGNYTNDSMFSPTSKDFQEMALTFCCFFFFFFYIFQHGAIDVPNGTRLLSSSLHNETWSHIFILWNGLLYLTHRRGTSFGAQRNHRARTKYTREKHSINLSFLAVGFFH